MTETRRTSARLNDFPIRSFRDIADDDYIAARLAFRSMLVPQFLWSSLQALEKYLKCILVLNCVQAKRGHDLRACLTAFEQANLFDLRITAGTHKFIDYLDTYGRHRYFETPFYVRGLEILSLDRAVWEIRRYAQVLRYELNVDGRLIPMLPPELRRIEAAETRSPHTCLRSWERVSKRLSQMLSIQPANRCCGKTSSTENVRAKQFG
jgi:HEPN domain-containing protein